MNMSKRTRLLVLAVASLAVAATDQGAKATGPWIRVNQVGYLADDPKIALLSSDRPLEGKFTVGELSASDRPRSGGLGALRP